MTGESQALFAKKPSTFAHFFTHLWRLYLRIFGVLLRLSAATPPPETGPSIYAHGIARKRKSADIVTTTMPTDRIG